MNSIEELAEHIKLQTKSNERFVVAISGFGGAGKSTLSNRLRAALGDATLIHTDDFIDADENGALVVIYLNWMAHCRPQQWPPRLKIGLPARQRKFEGS